MANKFKEIISHFGTLESNNKIVLGSRSLALFYHNYPGNSINVNIHVILLPAQVDFQHEHVIK